MQHDMYHYASPNATPCAPYMVVLCISPSAPVQDLWGEGRAVVNESLVWFYHRLPAKGVNVPLKTLTAFVLKVLEGLISVGIIASFLSLSLASCFCYIANEKIGASHQPTR